MVLNDRNKLFTISLSTSKENVNKYIIKAFKTSLLTGSSKYGKNIILIAMNVYQENHLSYSAIMVDYNYSGSINQLTKLEEMEKQAEDLNGILSKAQIYFRGILLGIAHLLRFLTSLQSGALLLISIPPTKILLNLFIRIQVMVYFLVLVS